MERLKINEIERERKPTAGTTLPKSLYSTHKRTRWRGLKINETERKPTEPLCLNLSIVHTNSQDGEA